MYNSWTVVLLVMLVIVVLVLIKMSMTDSFEPVKQRMNFSTKITSPDGASYANDLTVSSVQEAMKVISDYMEAYKAGKRNISQFVNLMCAYQYLKPAPTPGGNSNSGLKPSIMKYEGRNHYYQIPDNPRGTLVVLCGCARTGFGFWPYSRGGCAECAGLTEDVAHTKQALSRGLAIFVPTPVDKGYCWGKEDTGLPKLIPAFLKQHAQLRNKPVYIMGASSGGGLMLRAAGSLGVKFAGIIALVATKSEVPDFIKGFKGHYPPVVWITMSESKEIAAGKKRVAQYKKYGPAAMATAPAHKITPDYFSDRHPLITPTESALIATQLRKLGVIRADGSLVHGPKDKPAWLRKLVTSLPFLNNKNFQVPFVKSTLMQAMMVAESDHEHVCDYLTAALMWFEQGAKTDFDALAKKYRVVRPALLTMKRQSGKGNPTPAEAFAYGNETLEHIRTQTTVWKTKGYGWKISS